MPRCCACGLSSTSVEAREGKISFHRFPIPGRDLHNLWLEFVSLPTGADVKGMYLCSRHFHSRDVEIRASRKWIRHGAVPCLMPSKQKPIVQITNNHFPAPSSLVPCESNNALIEKAAVENPGIGQQLGRSLEEDVMQVDQMNGNGVYIPDNVWEGSNLGNLDIMYCEGTTSITNSVCYLCRICGESSNELISIFGTMSEDNISLKDKIQMYLPIQFSVGDKFPLQICRDCLNALESWHKLAMTCMATDAAFCNLLYEENGVLDDLCSSKFTSCDMALTNLQDPLFSVTQYENISLANTEATVNGQGNNMPSQGKNQELSDGGYTGSTNNRSVEISEGPKNETTEDFFINYHHIAKIEDCFCPWCSTVFGNFADLRCHKIKCRLLPYLCEFCGVMTPARFQHGQHRCKLKQPYGPRRLKKLKRKRLKQNGKQNKKKKSEKQRAKNDTSLRKSLKITLHLQRGRAEICTSPTHHKVHKDAKVTDTRLAD